MTPSAQKEYQPLSKNSPSEIALTHTETYDHELEANLQKDFGDEVKKPASKESPKINQVALNKLYEDIYQIGDHGEHQSTIGNADEKFNKEREEVAKKIKTPLFADIPTFSMIKEWVAETLRRGSTVRTTNSNHIAQQKKEQAALLGQILEGESKQNSPTPTNAEVNSNEKEEHQPDQHLLPNLHPAQENQIAEQVNQSSQPTDEGQISLQSLPKENSPTDQPQNALPISLDAYRRSGMSVEDQKSEDQLYDQVPQAKAA